MLETDGRVLFNPLQKIRFSDDSFSIEISEIGADAGANAISCEIDEAGPSAAPELVSSIAARRGLVLCFSQSSGKNTPGVT
jgi:hypothetical protein